MHGGDYVLRNILSSCIRWWRSRSSRNRNKFKASTGGNGGNGVASSISQVHLLLMQVEVLVELEQAWRRNSRNCWHRRWRYW
jgi:hypothetical protein